MGSRHPALSVYLADDHPVFREGVARAIKARPELHLVGQAPDGIVALDDIRNLKPAVAVLDLRMPGLDGVAVARALQRDGTPVRILMLTGIAESAEVYRALGAGVASLLSKATPAERICDAILATADGQTVLSPEFHSAVAGEIRRRDVATRPALTERERQVLAQTACGASAAGIGRTLHLSPATIRTHLQSLYTKLGVSDRAAAVATGLRLQLID